MRRVTCPQDGFTGTVIGSYTTLEGKTGVVVQQDGTKVVHVYGETRVVPLVEETHGQFSGRTSQFD